MKGCVPSIIKYILFAVNFLVLLMSLVVLGFSIYSLVDGQGVSRLVEEGAASMGENITVDLYTSASIILIIFSSLLVLLSFLGCCGAWKENRCVLFFYFAILLIIFLGTVIGATVAAFQNVDVIKTPLLKSMSQYDPETKDPEIQEVNKAWDDIQSEFSCCGVNNFEDWENVTDVYPDEKGNKVPASCCANLEGTDLDKCRRTPDLPDFESRMGGCVNQFQKSIDGNKETIAIVAGAIICFLFVNLVTLFGFALCLAPRSEYEQV